MCFSDACHSHVCLQVPSTPFLITCDYVAATTITCPSRVVPTSLLTMAATINLQHSHLPHKSLHLFLAPWFKPHSFFLFWYATVLLMLSCCLSPFDHHHHQVTGMFQHHSNLAALIHQSDVHFANTFHHCQWSTPHCLPSASSSSGLSAATATSITPDHQH